MNTAYTGCYICERTGSRIIKRTKIQESESESERMKEK